MLAEVHAQCLAGAGVVDHWADRPADDATNPTEAELAERGVNLVIYANHMLRAAYPQMVRVAETILEHGRALEADPYLASIKDALSIIPENQ